MNCKLTSKLDEKNTEMFWNNTNTGKSKFCNSNLNKQTSDVVNGKQTVRLIGVSWSKLSPEHREKLKLSTINLE